MGPLTLQQLAKDLKLSIGTVSKALRDSHEISPETKKRVIARAGELNFTPNPYASSLRRKKSKTIAVVLPEVADNFFSLAINGIQSVAESKGYHVLIYLSHESYANEKSILQNCRSGRVDGVLISISSETTIPDHINALHAANIPVVFFDRDYEGMEAAKIITNDFESGFLATEHLLGKHCRKLGFFSVSESLSICKKREEGFKAAMQKAGVDDYQVEYFSGEADKDYAQLKALMQSGRSPDAIIASVERIAIQLYLVCRELNIRIPDQLKLLAFSTLQTAPILSPPLTTITQPAFDIGKTAAELLFKGIEKNHFNLPKNLIVLPSVLIERESTR